MKKGLLTFVLREVGGCDCSNGGLSSKVDKVLLVSQDNTVQGPSEVKDGEDCMVLVKRNLSRGEYLHVVPITLITTL